MSLSNDLLSQFVKVNRDNAKPKTETTVYGTTVEYDGKTYVRLDGSDLLTPVESTVATVPGERVTVMIKDHTATITGNLSSPSARRDDLDALGSQISEFEIVLAHKIQTDELSAINATIDNLKATVAKFGDMEAITADIETLRAKYASLENVTAKDVEALNAEIENLQVKFGDFTHISAEDMEVINAEIRNLRSYNANFTYVSAEVLSAINATIKNLNTEYANIDFANIGEAAIRKIFADSGLIKDIIVGNGTITGELVGVTIKGDLIEGNTIKADKLVVKGEDGLYYKLNFESGNFKDAEEVPDEGIHGSVIIAKSITADRIAVTDLVAFGATIGGFRITNNAIHSIVKTSVDNTTRGIYMDNDGQMAFGDASSYVKYYQDTDGKYKLYISAESIVLRSSSKSIETMLDEMRTDVENIDIGGRNLLVKTAFREGETYDTWGDAGTILRTEDGLKFISGESYSGFVFPLAFKGRLGNDEGYTLSFEYRTNLESLGTVYALENADNANVFYTSVEPTTDAGFIFMLSDIEDGRSWAVEIGSWIVTPSGKIYVVHFIEQYGIEASYDETLTLDSGTNIEIGSPTIAPSETEWAKFEWTFSNAAIKDKVIRAILFPYVNVDTGWLEIKAKTLKMEKGNKATDWTPAPEDMATSEEVDNARSSANEAYKTAVDASGRVTVAESAIQLLSDSIASLVTDENGTSLMTQTANGWTFNMSAINETLNSASETLNDLAGKVDGVDNIVDRLDTLVNDLSKKTAYIIMATDETGSPCIELGKSDNDFKVRITNTSVDFMEGSSRIAYVSNRSLYIEKAIIKDELQIGEGTGFIWKRRSNGNLGLRWIGG